MEGQSPLEMLRQLVKVEAPDGMFFVTKDGTLKLLWNAHRNSAPYNTVQATFGDAGGSELPYLDLDTDFSESFLYNDITVTRTNGTQRTASDQASIDTYGPRPLSLTDVPVTSDSTAQAIAEVILTKHKDPMERVLGLTLTTAQPAVAEAAFRLDIGDRIQVKRTPPGGGARLDQTSFVERIEWSGANDGRPWVCRLGVSPL